MLATKATAYLDNPFLLIKFPAIALGLINVGALNLTRAWKEMGSRELSPREAAAARGLRRVVARLLAHGDHVRTHDRVLVITADPRRNLPAAPRSNAGNNG